LYNRSNRGVARGIDGNRRASISRGTRTVSPYDLPARNETRKGLGKTDR